MQRRSGLVAAVAVIVTTLLVACGPAEGNTIAETPPTTTPARTLASSSSATATPSAEPEAVAVAAHQPVFEPIDLTAALGASRPRFTGTTTLSAGTTTPALIAGIRSADAEHTELHTWTSADGIEWSDQHVALPGNVVSVDVAGDANLTTLSGLTSTGGVRGRFLFTSTDRVTWTTVAVPAPGAHDDMPVTTVVDGSVYYLVDNDRTDGQLLTITGSRTIRHPFPRTPDGIERTPIALAGSGATLVALVYEAPADADAPVVAYRSTDAGSTWSGPTTLSGPFDVVAGLIWTGSAFTATGYSRTGPDAATTMAAWSSADGAAWLADAVDAATGWDFPDANGDAWLGAPTAAEGLVMASAGDEQNLRNFAYARTPAGRWIEVRPGRPADNAGSAASLAIVTPAAEPSDAVIAMVTQQDDQSVTVQRTSPGSGAAFVRWGEEKRMPTLVLDDPSDGGLLLHTRGYTVQVDAGGAWSRTVQMAPFRWSTETGVTPVSWDPPGIENGYDIDRSTAADGSEVVLWNDYDFDRSLRTVHGAFRAGADSPWEATTGFDADLDVRFAGVAHADDGWYAYGTTGPDDSQVRLWSSSDGRTWQHQDATDPAHPSFDVSGACELADGTPLVVGRSIDTTGTRRPLTIVRDAGSWIWTVHGSVIADGLTACATADGATVVTGQDADGTFDLSTADGTSLTRIAPADPAAPAAADTSDALDAVGNPEPADPDHLYRQGVSDVAGGFYSVGYLRTSTFTGFVVWLSADGTTWRWVPLPVDLSTGGIQSQTVGTDVVLALSTDGGELAWRLTGLTELFA